MSTYVATKHPVGGNGKSPQHGAPPDSFLDVLVQFGKIAPDDLFLPNAVKDVFTILSPTLGPWQSLLHRRAAMLEALRVIAAFESSWNWREGADATAGTETKEEEEAGAFQVSYNSRRLGNNLPAFLESKGVTNAEQFIERIKSDLIFDVTYTVMLLRDATRWDGPLNRGWVTANVRRDAVAEFETLIS